MFGRTLVIVNPAARSGKAAEVAAHAALVFDRIQKRQSQPMRLTFRYTVGPKDATQIAQHEGPNYDTVVALGGDGLINEVANGLMSLPINQRPTLALIPCGNGDDFARTIGMSRKPNESLKQIESLALTPITIDVGRANDIWFLETLSFGHRLRNCRSTKETQAHRHEPLPSVRNRSTRQSPRNQAGHTDP